MSVLNGTTAVQVLFKKVSSTLDAWGFNFLYATFVSCGQVMVSNL